MSRSTIILIAAALLVAAGLSSIFIVDEREKALVLQFGQVRSVKETPGLAFKIPLIQEVVRYDDRILSLETQSLEVTPLDDRRLVVDAFARYRIIDVVRFKRPSVLAVYSLQKAAWSVYSMQQTREVLGSVSSNTVLSADRAALMNQIRDTAKVDAEIWGSP